MIIQFAWRYFKAKKTTNAINIIAWVSVVAIGFATTALIVLFSAFNGFEGLVKSMYATFYTDMRIKPASGKTMQISNAQIADIRQIPNIKNISFTAEQKALLQNDDYTAPVELKGVDSNYTLVTTIEDGMLRGQYFLGDEDNAGALLGSSIEHSIAILSDRSITNLNVFFPKKGLDNIADPMSSFTQAYLTPTGSFAIQKDFDNTYVLTNIAFVKKNMLFKDDEFSTLEIQLHNIKDERKTKQALLQLLGSNYKVETRLEQNSSLYSVMQLEKYAIYGIFLLVLIVAAFNMIGALTMLVMEKQKDIQILQAMGANRNMIQKIFLTEGVLLAAIGCGAGVVLGILICVIQLQFKVIGLPGSTFVIDYYPVVMQLNDFLVVIATVFIIAFLASWIPAKKAAHQAFSLKH